jgi:hypothetical protein
MTVCSTSSAVDGDSASQQDEPNGKTSDRGQGPPQQELALLAIATLQQDILSYIRRHPQSTAMQWLEDSGKQQKFLYLVKKFGFHHSSGSR